MRCVSLKLFAQYAARLTPANTAVRGVFIAFCVAVLVWTGFDEELCDEYFDDDYLPCTTRQLHCSGYGITGMYVCMSLLS